ncbi:unnamed protein product [Meganyctiphanes norvegica]|uniref:Reelin domain-containing protein n=1 Tax=Meganyctiphanes norvegica TaxID=48144 RepID=A0AAV2QXZ0_MEGNR
MHIGKSLLACVLLSSLRDTLGYPGGAPAAACVDMVPQHGATAQNTTAPFSFQMGMSDTPLGNNSRVTLNLEVNKIEYFKGLLLQAREVGSNQAIGTFYINENNNIKYLTCGDEGSNNAVTHSSSDKKSSIEVDWEPDDDFEGDVQFVATVVKDAPIYWVAFKSDTFSVTGTGPGLTAASSLVVLVIGLLALIK